MDNKDDANSPLTQRYTKEFMIEENSKFQLSMFIVEYTNAIQASVYVGKPSLGSMSFGYIDGDVTQNLEVFTGRDNQFSNAITLILAKRTNKIIYASVNLPRETIVELSMIKQLLDEFFKERNGS